MKKIKISLKALKFDKTGLIPAIIQDGKTNEVLMLAYMNKESLRRTLKKGKTCFWSRSRKDYWVKGATSGNFQYIKSVAYDCDMDALLIKVRQIGVACHTGKRSCFYRKIKGVKS
jgi:phosphoribosyl-AMP cyclohydrolase